MSDALLSIRGLETAYGAMQVLFGVDMEVQAGEIVAIIGPNGAGKSTVIKGVIGLAPARAGSIVFNGQDITRLAPHRIPALGIGYVPQGRIVFARMTVEDNLEMGAFSSPTPPSGARPWRRCLRSSRACASAAVNSPAAFPAASSRCSLSAAR